MISWSQNGIKMQISYLLILCSGILTREFLTGSIHHRAGTRVIFPGLVNPTLAHVPMLQTKEKNHQTGIFLPPIFRSQIQ